MKHAPALRRSLTSAAIVPTLLTMAGLSALCILTIYASDPASWNDPAWWSNRHAVAQTVVATNNGIVTTNYAPSYYVVANQGQLKQFTARAVDELNADLTNAGGAGNTLNTMVSNWAQDYATNGYSTNTASPSYPYKPSDLQAVNVGQLKYIAKQVYSQLSTAGYSNLYPSWLASSNAADLNAANLGQLKEAFNFNLSLPGASNLTATPGAAGTINLSWQLPSGNNAASWIIEEEGPNGVWNVIATLNNPDATSYSVTGLTPNQNYNFQVFASGTHSVSPAISVTASNRFGQLAAGDSFTMVNKPDGTVWIWGDDSRGQQGDNQANNPTPLPQIVSGLGQVIGIAAAGDHALAVNNSGNVWAWGADDQSQGGDGGTTDLLVPTQIAGLSNITTVWAGSENGFAVDGNGNLYGWGNNDNGQLGDGTTNGRSTPEAITSVTGVVKVVSNSNFTVVLKSDGTIWAAGSNSNGALGDGTYNNETAFQPVPNFNGVIDIAAGFGHVLALRSDGTVWSWGYNWDGELGNGNFNPGTNIPTQVSGLPPATAVEAVDSKSFVILADGTLRCFGGNGQGNLGLGPGNVQSQCTPIEPAGVQNVALLAAGTYHTVICTSSGAFFGWGDNTTYRLTQDFAGNNFNIPSEMHDPAWQGFVSVAGAGNTTIALKADGTVWAVGEGDNGSLGQGAWYSSQTPIQTPGLTGITKIAGCNQAAFAIRNDGSLWSWGGNWSGELGVGNYNAQNTPGQVSNVQNVTAVAAGDNHMLAVESNGTVWATGDDSQGELGDGTMNDEITPIQVTTFSTATEVAAGTNTSFVLKGDGTVWAWGQNDSGQLGLGITGNVQTPTQITSLPAITAISAQGNNAMGIDSSGNVWTWGTNGNSNGTPLEQSGLTSVTAIAAGVYHNLAIKSDGTLWGLGAGWLGQLGNNSYNGNSVFTQINDIQGAISIAASYGQTLVAKQDGTISGFGSCFNGEFGGNLGIYTVVPKPLFGIAMSETPPTVSISSPTSNFTATEGDAINFQASATASARSIAKVIYYLNGVEIGSSTNGGTWDCSWTPTSSGEMTFFAVAYDTAGVAQVSSPVSIIVSTNQGPPAPTNLTVTSGPQGSVYLAWNGLDYYATNEILIQEQSSGGGWTTIDAVPNSSETSYQVLNLTPGQNYAFRLVSANDSGSSTGESVTYSPSTADQPLLSKVSGDNQTIPANSFANPLVVCVTDSAGKALANVPVKFSLPTASKGGLAASNGEESFSEATITTNSGGNAVVYYQAGPDALANDTITASITTTSESPQVSFTARCGIQGGLAAWFSADSGIGTNASGEVTRWIDQSINSYSVGQADASSAPKLSQLSSGLPALTFSGNQFLTETDTALSGVNDVTIVTVTSTPSPTATQSIVAIGDGYGYNGCRILGYGSGYQQFTTSTTVNGGIVNTSGGVTIDAVTYSNANGTATFYSNGATTGSTTAGATAVTPSLTIGAPFDYSGYNGWTGQIAEVLIYNRVLTSNELISIQNYLANKYEITVPATTSITAELGFPFSYTIQSSLSNPTSFSASDLPSGLTINTETGVISGNPLVTGNSIITQGALNSSESWEGTLALSVVQASVTPPVVSPSGGIITSGTNIVIAPSSIPCQIYFTTDGSAPTSSSTLYSGTLNLTANCTLNCAYFINDQQVSPVTTEQFYVEDTSGELVGPSGLTATSGSGGTVSLNWTQPLGGEALTYEIEQQNPDGSWSIIATVPSTTSTYTVNGITIGETPKFGIFSVNSSYASSANITQGDPGLQPPSSVTSTPGTTDGEVNLTWMNHATSAKYILIEESSDDVTWSVVATVSDPTVTSYKVEGLNPGQSYYFGVSAGNN